MGVEAKDEDGVTGADGVELLLLLLLVFVRNKLLMQPFGVMVGVLLGVEVFES